MRITHDAFAGTLESSDAQVSVSPHDGLKVAIASTVLGQYGAQIHAVVTDTLSKLGVTDALVSVEDKGAFDFTIRARVQAACFRASGTTPDWSRL